MVQRLAPIGGLQVDPKRFIKNKVNTAKKKMAGIPLKPESISPTLDAPDIEQPSLSNVSSKLPQVTKSQVDAVKQPTNEMQGWTEVSNPFEGTNINPDDFLEEIDDTGSLDGWVETSNPFESSNEIIAEESDSNLLKDIVAGAGDTATGFGEFVGDQGANLISWVAKKLGADEEKTNSIRDEFKQYLEDSKPSATMGADTDSAAYQITKGVGDIAQTVAPVGAGKTIGSVINKGASIASKIPGAAKVGQLVSKAPGVVQKGIKLAGQGAVDAAKYDAIANQKIVSPKEAALGAGLNVAGAAVGEGISKAVKPLANKLQLSGLLNPKKLEYVANSLKETGDDVDNVANWMQERNIYGTKDQVVNKLLAQADETYMKVREAVVAADDGAGNFKDKSVNNALKELIDATEGVKSNTQTKIRKGLTDLLAKSKKQGLSLKEIQAVKDGMDDMLSIYTIAGDVKSGIKKADLASLRSDIRSFLEKNVIKNTGIDIKRLNRDTAVAKQLANSIKYKDKTDAVREMLSPFATTAVGGALGGLAGYGNGGSPDDIIKNLVIGATLGGLSSSTALKTLSAKALKDGSKRLRSVGAPFRRGLSVKASTNNSSD